ncbi:hypothetical protein [Komagataeibacter diospyri]|uniref:hypothetical protein n=1 Tax=Komagataeibacter diospyri TaxID=1932662 RepID=UPI001141589E|nr:hypothetical protein [Komagataeibacter diospyri]
MPDRPHHAIFRAGKAAVRALHLRSVFDACKPVLKRRAGQEDVFGKVFPKSFREHRLLEKGGTRKRLS